MAMYCPQCGASFEQRLQCAACGVRLLVPESRRSRGRFRLFAHGWQHTSWGRLIVGLVLAQGLFYGLRHMLTGILLSFEGQGTGPEALATPTGLVCVQVLQVIALLLGGLLAGAGRRGGFTLGLVLGVLNGIVAVVAQQWPATAAHSLLPMYWQPVLQGVVGAVGGWIGGNIWKPLAVVLGPDSATVRRNKGLMRPRMSLFAGRVYWFRLLFGSGLAVAGCLSATYLLDHALLASNDALTTDGYWQEKVVTWEIKALAMLLGATLAGAGTTNGFKQGLLAGLLAGVGLNVALASRGARLDVMGLTMASSLCLSMAGGWFGSQLFPPLSSYRRAKGMGPASIHN